MTPSLHHRLFLLLAFVVLLTACTDRRSPEEMASTLIYGYAEPFKTFDPARQIYMQEVVIIAQVLEPLLRWNNDIELEPFLATSWETPDDCRTWVFHLREGVKFHDGTPFNAEAVKIHFERILDPAMAATRRKRIEFIEKIEAPDPLTVVFHLREPHCIFPQVISGTVGSIPSPAALEKWGNKFGQHPVGTGPFIFEEWIPDVHIKMRRNPDYWRKELFHIDQLECWPVRENTTRLILLEQGVLDMAAISFAHVNVAKKTPDIILQSSPHLSIRYIGFNTQKPPFDNLRVRQACNYAVNKEHILKYMFFGVGEVARGPFPSVLPAFNHNLNPYDYNPEKARELMVEAGYPDGVDVTLWTTETGTYRVTADAVVDFLRKIGVRVETKIFDNAAYWDQFDEYLTRDGREYPTKEGCYDMYIGGWVGGEAPHEYLEPLFIAHSYSNSSFYNNPEVNRLLLEYKRTVDPKERDEIAGTLQMIIVDDAPWIFAFHSQSNIGLRQRVQGFKINPSGRLFLENVRLADEEET